MGLGQTTVTIYKNVFSKEPFYVSLQQILERIKSGHKCRSLIEQIRKGDLAKKTQLAAIVFSGHVEGRREDANLKYHSGLVILDFDYLGDQLPAVRQAMISRPDTVAVFLSPGGDGLKVLVRIADGAKHRQHYRALMREIEGLDEKNINETRVCFESYDPDIYINYNAQSYSIFIEAVRTESERKVGVDNFAKLEKWLANQGNVFASGNRNNYIFCLASACCRVGIAEEDAVAEIKKHHLAKDNEFTITEALHAIKSGYKRNTFCSAEFSHDILVETETRKEVQLVDDHLVRDVIYGQDVYADALDIYRNGYKNADTTGIKELDRIFKWKRGELTVLTGIGNHGKSSLLNFLLLNKSVKDGTRWAVFSPENYPASEFYHDLVEIVLGANCTPQNVVNLPSEEDYEEAYKFVQQHVFYIYPKTLSPTPEYIKSRFLELVIKEQVDGCIIDPFNQLSNDYSMKNNRDDKYLETFLSDCSRFAMANNVFMVIVAHPNKLRKNEAGNYDAPDVFDLSGGAMWNNKADNILVYHRPNREKDPLDCNCELHSKKIRRQKIVGELGMESFLYHRKSRRFLFDDFPLLHRVPAGLEGLEDAPF